MTSSDATPSRRLTRRAQALLDEQQQLAPSNPLPSSTTAEAINTKEPLVSPLLPAIELTTDLPKTEVSEVTPESGQGTSPTQINSPQIAAEIMSGHAEPAIREEDISVEIPDAPDPTFRDEMDDPGPEDIEIEFNRTSPEPDELTSVLESGPGGDVLRERMDRVSEVVSNDDDSYATSEPTDTNSTPRLTAQEKGKARASSTDNLSQIDPSNDRSQIDPTSDQLEIDLSREAQIWHDRQLAEHLLRNPEPSAPPSRNNSEPASPRSSTTQSRARVKLSLPDGYGSIDANDIKMEFPDELDPDDARTWKIINDNNIMLRRELARVKDRNNRLIALNERRVPTTRRSSSGVPPLVSAPRLATPVATPGQPLAFGVPIVNKPPVLPSSSGLARAMRGDTSEPSDDSSSSSSSSRNNAGGSGGNYNGNGNNNGNGGSGSPPRRPPPPPPGDSSSDSSSSGSEPDSNIFHISPPSDHSSDSEPTKRRKRHNRRKHRTRLERLKYQQGFLKTDPPFKYDGEVKASQFKKWVRENRAWIKSGRLSVRQGILNAGKYLTGNAYKYFERDVLRGRQHHSLQQFYNGMFDYLFPVSFREDQRDIFDTTHQGNMPGLTYLRHLEDLADTIGDLEEQDIVRAFTRRAKASIRGQLAMMGYRAEDLTLATLEILIVRIEKALETRDGINGSRRGNDRRDNDRGPKKPWSRDGSSASTSQNPPKFIPRPNNSSSRTSGHPNNRNQNNSGKTRTFLSTRNATGGKSQNRSSQSSGGPRKPWNKSPEDVARTKRLREEGRCFECESLEHQSKDCPKRNSKRPPVQVNSIGPSKIESQLELFEEGRKLQLFGIQGPSKKASGVPRKLIGRSTKYRYKLSPSERKHRLKSITEAERQADDEDQRNCTRIARELFLGAPYYYDIQTDYWDSPYDAERFIVTPYERWKSYSVVDSHNSDSYSITKEELENPELDLPKWLAAKKESGECVICLRKKPNKRYYVHWESQEDPEYYRSQLSYDFFQPSDGDETPSEAESGESLFGSDFGNIFDHEGSEYFDSDHDNPGPSTPVNVRISEPEMTGVEMMPLDLPLDKLQLCGLAPSAKSSARTNSKFGPDAFGLERTAARLKHYERNCPRPMIVVVDINGHPCRALIDSGSWSDFISTTLADQLKVNATILDKPVDLQLAVSGSRGKIKARATVQFEYQNIREQRDFDVCNLESYDCILGTPFLFQHQILLGMNPAQVTVRSAESLPIRGVQSLVIGSRAVELIDNKISTMRDELKAYASGICKDAADTPLPPLRAINHVIPLNDQHRVYSWRPSKCPEQLKPLWRTKRDDYLKTGRWEFRSGTNAVPMMMLKKPTKDGILRLRTVCDTRERNQNSRRLASPLPDIEAILRNVVSKPYRSLLDGKDAYEQIRIDPKDVDKSLFATPDGTMVSLVMQIGDCNASATYQSIMNYIFSDFLGVFMDVYLDDICVYSDTPEDHVVHVKKVIDRLTEHKFFLSAHKLQFFMEELKILGHVIDKLGIRMDPAKVDQVANWKTPTNKSLVASFIGSVGYLAPGCKNVRVDMAVLSNVAAIGKPWKWTYTEQRAFENVKSIVNRWRNTRRVSIDYSPGAPICNLCCDASFTGGSGVLSQGEDYKTAKVIAFWSGKFNPAQQNYPVHEQELLAIVESLKRFAHLLQGLKFRIYTDHKGLEWITTQKKLSPRQARWLEVLSEFDFEIIHIPGVDNILADSLSRLYSDEKSGVVRAPSEYIAAEDEFSEEKRLLEVVTAPMEIGEPLFLGAVDLPVRERSSRIKQQTNWRLKDLEAPVKTPAKKVKRSKAPVTSIVSKAVTTPNKKARGRPKKALTVAENIESPAEILEGERHPTTPKIEVEQPEATVTDDLEPRSEELSSELAETSSSGNVLTEFDHNAQLTSTLDSNIADDILSESAISLPDLVHSGDPTIDIHSSISGKYSEDPFFKTILDKPSTFKNFEVSNNLVFLKDNERRVLCIPDVLIGNRRLREILISHAHSILAHLGTRKTLIYLRESVWWKGMGNDVQAFCETCRTCATSKSTNHSPYGLLETLPIPSYPWETIGIDFVGPLPVSTNLRGSYDMILVAICHLTSMVHLIPTKTTYRAKDIAEVMFDHVYKLHGMPKNIVSDRDSLFTSTFWKRLTELTGTELRMSSSFHPQTDGATERANRTMTQMLRQCVEPGQKNWLSKLPAIEFAMNSASSQTTGYAPFYLNNGRMPRSMLWNSESKYPGVRKFAQDTKDAVLGAHDAIITARVKQTQLANRKRKETPFAKGDLVYLSTANLSLPKGRAKKLAPKFVGPYKILEDYKNNTFKLDLPPELKARGLHHNFHASLLRIHIPNDDRRFPGRQMDQIRSLGNVEEWAVAEIDEHHGQGANALFHLVWKSGDSAWVPLDQVSRLEALTAYLEAQGVAKPKDLPKQISRSDSVPLASIGFEIQKTYELQPLETAPGRSEMQEGRTFNSTWYDNDPSSEFENILSPEVYKISGMKSKIERRFDDIPETHLEMSPSMNNQLIGASKFVISYYIAIGLLHPDNYKLSRYIANFLALDRMAFGLHLNEAGLTDRKRLTFQLLEGGTVDLTVPCRRVGPTVLQSELLNLYPNKETGAHCTSCNTAATHFPVPCPLSGKRSTDPSLIEEVKYPDHLHLTCRKCSKPFVRKVFTCPACKHPLDVPADLILVNNNSCGTVHQPKSLIEGTSVSYLNIPRTSFAYCDCPDCEDDIGDQAIEIPCLKCKKYGFPKEFSDRREAEKPKDPRPRSILPPTPPPSPTLTWDMVKPPNSTLTTVKKPAWVNTLAQQPAKPIPTGPRAIRATRAGFGSGSSRGNWRASSDRKTTHRGSLNPGAMPFKPLNKAIPILPPKPTSALKNKAVGFSRPLPLISPYSSAWWTSLSKQGDIAQSSAVGLSLSSTVDAINELVGPNLNKFSNARSDYLDRQLKSAFLPSERQEGVCKV